jgi:hypothetical protein
MLISILSYNLYYLSKIVTAFCMNKNVKKIEKVSVVF